MLLDHSIHTPGPFTLTPVITRKKAGPHSLCQEPGLQEAEREKTTITQSKVNWASA